MPEIDFTGITDVDPDQLTERHVLACILLDPSTLEEIQPILTDEDFASNVHNMIFRAMLDCECQGMTPDIAAVASSLKALERLNTCGGFSYLESLTDHLPKLGLAAEYARQVKDKSSSRKALAALQLLSSDGQATLTPSALKDRLQGLLGALTADSPVTLETLNPGLDESLGFLQSRLDNPSALDGIATGFEELDLIYCGLQKGRLYVIAARPGTGKTAFALDLMRSAAGQGKKCAFFSLEMPRYELTDRLLCMVGKVNNQAYRIGLLDQSEKTRIQEAAQVIRSWPVKITDRSGLTLRQLESQCIQMQKNEGLDIAFVDYLQLMKGEGRERKAQVGSVSLGLKELAKTLRIPIVALAQLNRSIESRETDATPKMSDLGESGNIEQDADSVAFLTGKEGRITLTVEKNRGGMRGSVDLTFVREFGNFLPRS